MFAHSEKLASTIDHTCLRADVTDRDIENLCREAVQYGFHAVCVPPCFVPGAKRSLERSKVKICTVAGFPLGWTTKFSKQFDALEGMRNGADELDIVMNIGAAKSGRFKEVKAELEEVLDKTRECIHKIIVEMPLLEEKELRPVLNIMNDIRPDFVKTSTGYHRPVSVEDVGILKEGLRPGIGIKAAGGIRTYEAVKQLVKAGATRIGTSAGVAIIEEYLACENK